MTKITTTKSTPLDLTPSTTSIVWADGVFPETEKLCDGSNWVIDVSDYVKVYAESDGTVVAEVTYIPLEFYGEGVDEDIAIAAGMPNLGSGDSRVVGGDVFLTPTKLDPISQMPLPVEPSQPVSEDGHEYDFLRKNGEFAFKVFVELNGQLYQVEGYFNED